MASISLQVNGKAHVINAAPDIPLLWVLRDILHMTGTKFGCGMGHVRRVHRSHGRHAIRVLPDSRLRPWRARTSPPSKAFPTDGSHPVQQAWIEEDVPQCGYCQSGQIMTAVAPAREEPRSPPTPISTKP